MLVFKSFPPLPIPLYYTPSWPNLQQVQAINITNSHELTTVDFTKKMH